MMNDQLSEQARVKSWNRFGPSVAIGLGLGLMLMLMLALVLFMSASTTMASTTMASTTVAAATDDAHSQSTDRYVATSGADAGTCADANAPCRTIGFAASIADPGDTILVAAGTYTESIPIDRALTIQGAGREQTILDGEETRQLLNVSAPLQLNGLSVVRGFAADSGGGLYTTHPLTLANVTVAHNRSEHQGGGFFGAQSVVLSSTQIISNVSIDRGGGAYISGTLTMANSTLQGNSCIGRSIGSAILQHCHGGGLFTNSHVEMANSQFIGNSSLVHGGGGVFGKTDQHTVTLKSVEFIGNRTGNNAGGAFFHGNLVANDALFQENQAGVCAGGFWANSKVDLTDARIIRNESISLGGGAYIDSKWQTASVELTDVLIEGNHSHANGGGMFTASGVLSVHMMRTQLVGNRANEAGGGIVSNSGTPFTITDSHLEDNHALAGHGGGAYLQQGAHVLTGVTLRNNHSVSTGRTAFGGGGLYVSGSLTLNNSRVMSNSASLGGGLYITEMGGDEQVKLTNVLLGNNRAEQNGAALYVDRSGQTQVVHTTIAAPEQIETAAIHVGGGTVGITNTIIANHAVGIQQSGGSVHEDYSLFSANGTDRSGAVAVGSHSKSGAPHFINPAGEDYRPGIGSAAVDAGMDMGVPHDLEQTARPQGAGVDIGAYEAPATDFVVQQRLYLPLLEK